MERSSKRGFTLAELLIVIAIVAILAAVLFPVFGAQLNKARAAAELANVRIRYGELVSDAILNTSLTPTDRGVMIQTKKLAKSLRYVGTTIEFKHLATLEDPEEPCWIRVTYKGYSGQFNTDGDVQFDKTETIEKTGADPTDVTFIENPDEDLY